jgi:hypothetical protein
MSALSNPRYDLWNHSPTGFEWGYSGSGPAQLALAILADHIGDDEAALEAYQFFKFNVLASLPESGWTLSSEDIDAGLEKIRTEDIGIERT